MSVDTKTAVERLDWRTLMKVEDDTSPETVAMLDKYFEPFAQPAYDETRTEKPMLCLECGETLTGMFAGLFSSGGFTWDLVHGEGFCRGCKWPGRAMHYIKDADGKEVISIRNFVLQYHPDFVTRKAARKP